MSPSRTLVEMWLRQDRDLYKPGMYWKFPRDTVIRPTCSPVDLREPALREDTQAWLQAWREIDATLCADLRNRMRSAPVTLTLCSEHAAHRYQSTAQSPMQQLWQRAHRLFQPLTIHTALQAL